MQIPQKAIRNPRMELPALPAERLTAARLLLDEPPDQCSVRRRWSRVRLGLELSGELRDLRRALVAGLLQDRRNLRI